MASPQSQPPQPQSLFCSIIAGDDNDNDNDNDDSFDDDNSYINDDTLEKELYKFLNQLGKRNDVLLLPPDYTRFHSQAGKITQIISEYYNCIKKDQDNDKDIDNDNDNDKKDDNDAGGIDEDKVVEKAAASAAAAAAAVKTTSDDDDKEKDDVVKSPALFQIMPALGTHAPMTKLQIKKMFGTQLAKLNNEREDSTTSPNLFLEHKWKTDVVTIGHVPNNMVLTATNGLVNEPWPAQLNKLVWTKRIKEQKVERKVEEEEAPKPEALVLSIGQVVPHEVMGMANYNKNLFVG
jgi:hypothetical protein